MSGARSLAIVALATLLSFAGVQSKSAEGEGKVTSESSILTINGRTYGFAAMKTLEIDGQPAASFGLHKPPGGKPRYTYLLLFKSDPKAETGLGAGGGGTTEGIDSDGKIKCELQLTAMAGERKIELEYKLDANREKIASETLKIGGKEYGKDGPRVFLVDLTDKKAEPIPVKLIPQAVPDFADEDAWGKQILAAIKEVREKTEEGKKFFGEKK